MDERVSRDAQTTSLRVSHLRVSEFSIPKGHRQIQVDAGHRGKTRIVPPAGERWAFDVDNWARRVTVSVSRTGRSVRVWVDGEEIHTRESRRDSLPAGGKDTQP